MAFATRLAAALGSPSVAEPGWKQTAPTPSALERFISIVSPAGGALPLVRLGRGHAQDVGGVDHHVLRLDARLVQRRLEALHPFGLDGGLVAVEAGDGGKALQRPHSRAAGAQRGHVHAAVVDGVGADEVLLGHGSGRFGGWRMPRNPRGYKLRRRRRSARGGAP